MSEINNKKKTRRQWLYDIETDTIVTKGTSFPLTKMTPEADTFLKLYGCKQYLADCIASKGGDEFSDEERADLMTERFNNLCDDKFLITHTESGFYFKDPAAVSTKRTGIKQSALYNGLIEMGKSHEEALAFITKIKTES